jgi:hypothetical protein
MKTQAPLPSQFALVESRQQSASGLIKDSSEHEQSPSAQGVMSSQIRTRTILRHTPGPGSSQLPAPVQPCLSTENPMHLDSAAGWS